MVRIELIPCGRTEIAAIAAALVLAFAAPTARAATVLFETGGGRPESVETTEVDGTTYFRFADVAAVAGAARHWNAKTGKASLSTDRHSVSVSSGNQFALLDGEVVNLARPVREADGALWVPPEFIRVALADITESDIVWTPGSETATVRRRGVTVKEARIEESDAGTLLVLETNGLPELVTRSRNRGTINIYIPGATLQDTLDFEDGDGLVTAFIASADDDGFSGVVSVAPGATGYDAFVRNDPPRAEILITASTSSEIPSADLRGAKQLRPGREEILGASPGGIETVMIDPGHGGSDTGAVGPSGLQEKDANLAIARELARRLQRAGFYVFMTRSSDSFVPLTRRSEIANLAVADLYVGIHCDASLSRYASGHSVCYYRPPTAPPSRVSLRPGGGLEPASRDGRPGSDDLDWSGVQNDYSDESRALARAVHTNMTAALSTRDRGISGRTLAALAGCAMPAVHVEVAFLSNREDEKRLDDAQFVDEVARALTRGIIDYRNEARGRNQ